MWQVFRSSSDDGCDRGPVPNAKLAARISAGQQVGSSRDIGQQPAGGIGSGLHFSALSPTANDYHGKACGRWPGPTLQPSIPLIQPKNRFRELSFPWVGITSSLPERGPQYPSEVYACGIAVFRGRKSKRQTGCITGPTWTHGSQPRPRATRIFSTHLGELHLGPH